MKFQVLSQNNTPLMVTASIKCIPTSKELISMERAGYKFKMDNKMVSRKKVIEFTTNNKEKSIEKNSKI